MYVPRVESTGFIAFLLLFDREPRFTKVVKRDTSSPARHSNLEGSAAKVARVSKWYVFGTAFQWRSITKVSIEHRGATRHFLDTTEKSLKTM